MNVGFLEGLATRIRHAGWLENRQNLWRVVRPMYERVITRMSPDGIERLMNGTDSIRLSPQFRNISTTYEPEAWSTVMAEVREKDRIVDVGAYIGLYTIAFAQRVGQHGVVYAFRTSSVNEGMLD